MQDPLRGEPGTQLHNLGVKSGDLLYVLPSQQGQAPAESTAGACAAAPEPKRMRDGGVNGPAVQPQQDPPRQPQAEAEQSPAMVEVQLLPPTQLPACLRNTLEKNCSSKALVWPADVLLLAAHAAMLDAQFVPSWAVAFGSDAVARLHVPASCRLSRTTWRITYHLVLEGAAGGQAGGTDGRGSSNAGAVRQHQSGTCVVLHSSSIGSGGVVLAVAAQHHARHVSLHAASYVQPVKPPLPATSPSFTNGCPGGGRRPPAASLAPPCLRQRCVQTLMLRLVLRPLQHQPQLRHQSLSIRRSTCCGLTWRVILQASSGVVARVCAQPQASDARRGGRSPARCAPARRYCALLLGRRTPPRTAWWGETASGSAPASTPAAPRSRCGGGCRPGGDRVASPRSGLEQQPSSGIACSRRLHPSSVAVSLPASCHPHNAGQLCRLHAAAALACVAALSLPPPGPPLHFNVPVCALCRL